MKYITSKKQRERHREWLTKNKDKVKQWRRERYLKHKKEENEYARKYYQEHLERIKKREAEYRKKNKSQRNIQSKEWRQKNKKRVSKYNEQYREQNPKKVKVWRGQDYRNHKKEYSFRARQRKIKQKEAEGSFTLQEWELLKRQYGHCCPCCKKCEPEIKLVPDHIKPLSKGGTNYIRNIQPLCEKCNKKKYTKTIKF